MQREKNVEDLVAVRDSSIDFYAALRSAYTQAREGAIRQRRPISSPVTARLLSISPRREQHLDRRPAATRLERISQRGLPLLHHHAATRMRSGKESMPIR
jgi:hypothetical protein